MVTYLGKFIPNLSDLTIPLRQLVKRDVHFNWMREQDIAYDKIIDLITRNTILSYYKFHQYIAGKPFEVESDHKPLVPIFKKPLNDIPIRLQ